MQHTILILAANPTDTKPLRLDQEVRDIREGLQRSQQRDAFKLETRHALRAQDLRRALLEVKPSIVHFSGHGEGLLGLMLEDHTGKAQAIPNEALGSLLSLFKDKIQCVLLNACYSRVQAEVITHYIPYVIGMSEAISDKAALEYAVAFYDALGAGESFEFAHQLGVTAIGLAGIKGVEIPVLLTNTATLKEEDGKSTDIKDTQNPASFHKWVILLYYLKAIMIFIITVFFLFLIRYFIKPLFEYNTTSQKINFPTMIRVETGELIKGCIQGRDTTKELESCFENETPKLNLLYKKQCSELQDKNQELPRYCYKKEKIKAFMISDTEITFQQWEDCVQDGGCNKYIPNHSASGTGSKPIINVSFNDVKSYLSWLSNRTSKNYRLPTELEWEYAARANSQYAYYWGKTSPDINQVNYKNACITNTTCTKDVRSYPKNSMKLYDTAGNVWEWVEDECKMEKENLDSSPQLYYFVKGGSWNSHDPVELRPAYRRCYQANFRSQVIGFRVAHDIE